MLTLILYNNIFFNKIFNECRKLKRDCLIHKFWTRNDFVCFKYEDNEDILLPINHFELNNLFYDYYKDGITAGL